MISPRFKLQTMEYGVPSIVISKNGIFLSTNLYKKMGTPSFVQIYLSSETKELALVPCSKEDPSAVELKLNGEYARIYNKDFINNIATLCGQSFSTVNLKIIGQQEDNYFVFNLATGTINKAKSKSSAQGGDV